MSSCTRHLARIPSISRFLYKPLNRLAIAALIAGSTLPTAAAETYGAEPPDSSLQAINLRIDNDLFAGSDRGYSNGIEIGFLSQTVEHFQDKRLPTGYRWLNRGLGWLQPKGFSEYNMALNVGHGIFTPGDWQRRDLIEDDRPYAGVLVLGVDYNGRDDHSMRSVSINLGVVGPSARGEELQRGVHKLLGSETFRGWRNQLDDEIVFRIQSAGLHRFRFERRSAADWQRDLILRSGGSIGNLVSAINIGAEWRFGPQLPDDFGSAPLVPVAVNAAPTRARRFSPRMEMHGFVVANLDVVFHDITLDGNTWKDSHSVDRNPYVAGLGVGVAATYGHWRLAFARYLRTREFKGQSEPPQLGSLTIQREL